MNKHIKLKLSNLVESPHDPVHKLKRFTRSYNVTGVIMEEDVPRTYTIVFDNQAEADAFAEVERGFTKQHLGVEDNLADEGHWFVFNFILPDGHCLEVTTTCNIADNPTQQ